MKNKKLNISLLILSLVTLVFCIVTSSITIAKFIANKNLEGEIVETEDFYFTVDLLGDTNFEDSLTKNISLYGTGEKQIDFKTMNYFDSNRITETAISYSINLESNNSYLPTLSDESESFISKEFNFTNSKEMQNKSFSIVFNEGFTNGTIITITIGSTVPYTKTMKLIFTLSTHEFDVSYRIVDNEGDSFATLIITCNEDIAKEKLYIDWSNVNSQSNALLVDMTNPYLLDGLDLITNAPSGDYLVEMYNTIAINQGEVISIKFFKEDFEIDYSKVETSAIYDEENETYCIVLTTE